MPSGRSASSPVARDHDELALRSIGAELQSARLDRGEDLQDVAAYLRIRPAFLAALEAGDMAATPGRTYSIGFLRSYADHLGIDGNGLVRRLKTSTDVVEARHVVGYRERSSESRLPTALLLVASAVLTAAVAGAYRNIDTGQHDRLASMAETPPKILPPTATATPTADVTSAVAAEASSPAVLVSVDGETAVAPIAATGSGRIALLARASNWIQLRSIDRTFVRSGTMQPGERLALPGRVDLVLSTADAGAVEILLDGQTLGVLGAANEVVRNLPMRPEGLKRRLGRAD